MRFAREETFKFETHGGTRLQNLSLVPYMILMGQHLLDAKAATQRVQCERILQQFIQQAPASWMSTTAQTDSVPYMLVLSLQVLSLEEWLNVRLLFVKRAIVYADLHQKVCV